MYQSNLQSDMCDGLCRLKDAKMICWYIASCPWLAGDCQEKTVARNGSETMCKHSLAKGQIFV